MYTILRRIAMLTMTLTAGPLLAADISSATTSQVNGTDTTTTFSGAGQIALSSSNTAILIGNATTGSTVTVGNTTSAKEIQITQTTQNLTEAAILVSSANVGSAPVTVTIDSNAVVEANLSPTFANLSGSGSTGTLNFVNNGTLRNVGAFGNIGSIVINEAAGSNMPTNITNNGTITSTSSGMLYGIHLVRPASATQPLNITNGVNGSMIGDYYSIYVNDNFSSNYPLTITNSGSMPNGIRMWTHGSSSPIKVINNSTGTISGTFNGAIYVGVDMTSPSSGSNIENAGTLTSAHPNLHTIGVNGTVPSLYNSGTISNTGTGSSHAIKCQSGRINTITNTSTGVITSTNGVAFFESSFGSTTFNNSGTITGGSGVAMDVTVLNLTLNQLAGTITGNLNLTSGTHTLNFSGGTVAGNTTTSSATASQLNILGNFTTGGTFTNVPSLSVQNAGTVFTVAHNMTGINSNFSTATNTTMHIKNGSSVSGTFAGTFTNNGTLSFELGSGTDSTTAAITNNSNGYINIGTRAFNAATAKFEVTKATNATLSVDSRYYILRTSGAVTNIGTATLSSTSITSNPFALASDSQGIYVKVLAPVAIASSAVPAALAPIQTISLSSSARSVVSQLSQLSALSYLKSVIFTETDTVKAKELVSRLTPTGSSSAAPVLTANTSNYISTAVQMRTTLASQAITPRRYSAGSVSAMSGVWGQYVGGQTTQHNTELSVGYVANSNGFALGADTEVLDDQRVGIALGYMSTKALSNFALPDVLNLKSVNLIAYGLYKATENTILNLDINYGYNRFNSTRWVPAVSSFALAKYLGSQKGVRVNATHKLAYGHAQVDLMSGIRLSETNIDPYAERGALQNANLYVQTPSATEAVLSAGGRARYFFKKNYTTVVPNIQLMANYDFRGQASSSEVQFLVNSIPSGSSLSVRGDKPSKMSWTVGGGISFMNSGSWSAEVQVSTLLKRNYHSESGALSLRYSW